MIKTSFLDMKITLKETNPTKVTSNFNMIEEESCKSGLL